MKKHGPLRAYYLLVCFTTWETVVHGFCQQPITLFQSGRLQPTEPLVCPVKLSPGGNGHLEQPPLPVQDEGLPEKCTTQTASFTLSKRSTPRRRLFRRSSSKDDDERIELLNFSYDFDELEIDSSAAAKKTTGVVLIHPIGVGIGKWFHQRLLSALQTRHDTKGSPTSCRLAIISLDLLGSGSACNVTRNDDDQELVDQLPLLNISDWTDQIVDRMAKTEQEKKIDDWCVVANGGCSPIALQVAKRSVDGTAPFQKEVSNVILSSVPRLAFFFTSSDPSKVAKSYRTLCGTVGKLFWWYSCRNEGSFIQKFSEKNLVADPRNLGDRWRPNCYETAKRNGGKSRYTTFAFLAGTLQDGCVESLEALKDTNIRINIIKGKDVSQNRAKSWFWQKSSKRKPSTDDKPSKTFRDYVEENGNGGREISIGGRISLAHEDAVGYSDAIVEFLQTD